MPTTTKPSTTETGHPGGMGASWDPHTGPSFVASSYETTLELAFPYNLAVYDRMRREDGQIGSLLRAINQPILKTPWRLNTDGVDPAVAKFVETELGLLAPGKARQQRRREGIVWKEHLRQALLCLPFGFMPFELTYIVGPPTAEQAAAGIDGDVAHIRKLAPRLPRTVREIRVDRDGGLGGIVQTSRGWDIAQQGARVYISTTGVAGFDDKLIPARDLVMYSHEREGADWAGSSILRTAYKHWLLKDVLYRVGAQSVERNGMGLPIVEYDGKKGNEAKALEIASAARAGATAGVALESGVYSMKLLGVEGATKDELPLVNHHDQSIGRSALAMFLNLGHDNGARALGDTFVDVFTDSLNAEAGFLADIATEHIIRDLVDINFGEDEPYPTLVPDQIAGDSKDASDALATLADARLITPDDKLEAEIRRRRGLPEADKASARPADAPGALPASADNPFDPSAAAPSKDSDPLAIAAAEFVARLSQLRSGE